jgi:hypothetical protein
MLKRMAALGVLALMTGCGDPLQDFDRITDVTLAEDAASAQALPSSVETIPAELAAVEVTAETDGAETQSAGGLFGLFRRTRDNAAVAAAEVRAQPVAIALQSNDTVQAEEIAPTGATQDAAATRTDGWGIFASRSIANAGGGSEAVDADAAFGTVLPYGQIARVCDARGKNMGTRIEKGPARGFALYDSAPGSVAARTYYLIGFADGCPRQLTAANVLIGAPGLYDLLHYGPAAQDLPHGATDAAYEKVKSRVCGVSRKKPCGARTKALERTTVFVTAYDTFGNASRWSEMLIHDGQVIATAMKEGG